MSVFFQWLLAAARRNPVATLSVMLLIVLGGADWFLWRRWGNLAVESERTRQEGEKMLLSLSSHPRIHAQFSEANQALAYIDSNLAAEADLAGNLDYFYQFEKNTRVRLTNLSQLSSQPPADAESFLAIPFSLRLTGSYPQILSYLHALETGPRLVRVKSYRFTQAGVEALTADLTVEMLGRP